MPNFVQASPGRYHTDLYFDPVRWVTKLSIRKPSFIMSMCKLNSKSENSQEFSIDIHIERSKVMLLLVAYMYLYLQGVPIQMFFSPQAER